MRIGPSVAVVAALGGPAAAGVELAVPRCFVSARAHAVACPNYLDVRGERDAGWLVVHLWGLREPDLHVLVVHVGTHYVGTIAFDTEIGVPALERRLARDGFVLGERATPVAIGAWLSTTPRARLVATDDVQHDVALEVDCGNGRLERDDAVVTGDRFRVQLVDDPRPGATAVVFGETVERDGRIARTQVGSLVVAVGEVCGMK